MPKLNSIDPCAETTAEATVFRLPGVNKHCENVLAAGPFERIHRAKRLPGLPPGSSLGDPIDAFSAVWAKLKPNFPPV
jgi:hypothetical protein